eukprot:11209901-Lingulodinium_polyedra.AAC.1
MSRDRLLPRTLPAWRRVWRASPPGGARIKERVAPLPARTPGQTRRQHTFAAAPPTPPPPLPGLR